MAEHYTGHATVTLEREREFITVIIVWRGERESVYERVCGGKGEGDR